MLRRVEVGQAGQIQKLKNGEKFDLFENGIRTLGQVIAVVPPYNDNEPEIERIVTAEVHGRERYIAGKTIVMNWGSTPELRNVITEKSFPPVHADLPGYATGRDPLGFARSPIIPGTDFTNQSSQ